MQQLRVDMEVERWQLRIPTLEPRANHLERRVNKVNLRLGSDRGRQSDVPNAVLSQKESVVEDDADPAA